MKLLCSLLFATALLFAQGGCASRAAGIAGKRVGKTELRLAKAKAKNDAAKAKLELVLKKNSR